MKTKFKKLRQLSLLFLGAFITNSASASVIIQATSVSSPSGSFGGSFDISKSIDQSGLSANYISGVTDFDTFTATTSHSGESNSGFLSSNDSLPQYFSFDLGSSYSIDALAFWSTQNLGSVTDFELFADSDLNIDNGLGTLLGVFSASNSSDPTNAQIFNFAVSNTQYVHLEVKGPLPASLDYGIGEVAFRAVPVPEPSTWAMFAIGSLGIFIGYRKRKNT